MLIIVLRDIFIHADVGQGYPHFCVYLEVKLLKRQGKSSPRIESFFQPFETRVGPKCGSVIRNALLPRIISAPTAESWSTKIVRSEYLSTAPLSSMISNPTHAQSTAWLSTFNRVPWVPHFQTLFLLRVSTQTVPNSIFPTSSCI